jgi:hypothetical protein
MKPVGSLRWVAFGVALAAVSLAASVQAANGRARVYKVQGTAEYAEKAGDWQSLREGKVLNPGATVRTGSGSQLDLDLGDNGPSVRLLQDTTVGLDRLTLDRSGADVVVETQLDLKAGTILGYVKKLSPASKYEVKTPSTVMGIKATEGPTEYQISADGKHSIREGQVLVVYTNPVTRQPTTHPVNAGQTFIPPTTPTATTVPELRPTRPTDFIGEIPRPPVVPPPPTTPVTTVPEPVQFISPASGIVK